MNRKSKGIAQWATSTAAIFLACFIPLMAAAQTAPGGTATALLAPFANNDKSHLGGADLAKWAEDSVAVELAATGRFDILKQSEIDRQARELGYRPPYGLDEVQRIAVSLGASAIISGEIAYVLPRMRNGLLEAAEVGLTIRVLETSFGDLVNGAAAIGVAPVKPTEADLDTLARVAAAKAAIRSVRDLLSTMLPEGTVTHTVTSLTGDKHVLINRGSRDGIEQGMEMIVLRSGQRVGRIRVSSVFATDSEARIVDTTQGIAPMDRVRAVFDAPRLRPPR